MSEINNLTEQQIRDLYIRSLKNKDKINKYTYNLEEYDIRISDDGVAEWIIETRKKLKIPSEVTDELLLHGFLPGFYELYEAFGDKIFNMYCVNYLYNLIPKKTDEQIITPISIREIKLKEGVLRGNKHMIIISQKNGLLKRVKILYNDILNIKTTPSKLTPDIFESIIGIVFKSYNDDFHKTFEWIDKNLKPYFDREIINEKDSHSILNLLIQNIAKNKKIQNKKFNVNNKDYITKITFAEKGQLKKRCMIVHPDICSQNLKGAIPIKSHVNGVIGNINSRPLGYKPVCRSNLEDWLKKKGDDKLKWIDDSRYSGKKARDYLQCRKNEENNISLEHGLITDSSQTNWLLNIIIGKRNNIDVNEKIEVPPGSFVSSLFKKWNKGDKINKGDIIGYIYLPDMLIYGRGYNKSESEADMEAAMVILANKGDLINKYSNTNINSVEWKNKLKRRRENAQKRQANNSIYDRQSAFKINTSGKPKFSSNRKSPNNSPGKKISVFVSSMKFGEEEKIINSFFPNRTSYNILTDNNKPNGKAFVDFRSEKERNNALMKNGMKFNNKGRKIKVEIPRKKKN